MNPFKKKQPTQGAPSISDLTCVMVNGPLVIISRNVNGFSAGSVTLPFEHLAQIMPQLQDILLQFQIQKDANAKK